MGERASSKDPENKLLRKFSRRRLETEIRGHDAGLVRPAQSEAGRSEHHRGIDRLVQPELMQHGRAKDALSYMHQGRRERLT
jgi:hypothetical protein